MNHIPSAPPGYRWKLAIDPWYADGLRAYYLELRRNLFFGLSRRVAQTRIGLYPDDVHRDSVAEAARTLLDFHDGRDERRRFNETIRAFNDDQGRDQ